VRRSVVPFELSMPYFSLEKSKMANIAPMIIGMLNYKSDDRLTIEAILTDLGSI